MAKKHLSFFTLILLTIFFSTSGLPQERHSLVSEPFSEKLLQSNFSSNNTLNANSRCFVYLGGTSNNQLYKHFLGNMNLTPIGSPFTTAGWLGGMARDISTGMLYINNQSYPFQIWRPDTVTGICTQIIATCTGIPHANFTGLVFDHTTGNMYGLSSDLVTSAIFTINMSTGVCTQVGTSSAVCAGGIGIYCSPCGSLFVSDIVGNNLYKVNKTTGIFTLVGALGFDANYGQDGAFDLSDGILYLCSAGPGNHLRICDTVTGSATVIVLTYPSQPLCLAIAANPGPGIQHTPLPNTQNLAGPYVVNAVITPSGSPISSSKIFWSRNNPAISDSVTLANTSGNNWTGNIPGNGSVATYRYYLKVKDSIGRTGYHPVGAPIILHSFQAMLSDTVKPVITHTPLGNISKALWPVAVSASVTDNIGIDSVWVRWYKNIPSSGYRQFKLLNTSGNIYSAVFNSINSEVEYSDSIFYRIIAQDNSTNHNRDSTPVYKFKIVLPYEICIGTGTSPSNYPFTTYWMDGQTLMLFTASELLAGGMTTNFLIRGIGFNVISASPQVMNGFWVGLQHTSLTTLTGWVTTGWTTVYSGTYTVPGIGWQYINFPVPSFYYNGTSNLLVYICYDNSSYTSYSMVNATPTTGMTWGYHTDNSAGCTMTAGTSQPRPNTCFSSIICGTENISNLIPERYSLSQNYPNPFNPVTRINFAIPKQGLVTLKVYDVLGREIKTLVNEVKAPGSYSVDFNGAGLPSGVYFYKLESNLFSDIKRMILVK